MKGKIDKEGKKVVSPFEYAIIGVCDPENIDNYREETLEEKTERLKTELKTAKEMYNSGIESIKQFALDNYTEEELTKKERIKSWEELEEIEGYYIDPDSKISEYTTIHSGKCDRNVFKTKEQAKAAVAIAQLSQLMAHKDYNGDWVADWNSCKEKYFIYIHGNKVSASKSVFSKRFLTFKNEEVRNAFLENFRDLIIKAKPLL